MQGSVVAKKKINIEMFKNTPKLVFLMETIYKYEIDINKLNEEQQNEIIACLFIASR